MKFLHVNFLVHELSASLHTVYNPCPNVPNRCPNVPNRHVPSHLSNAVKRAKTMLKVILRPTRTK